MATVSRVVATTPHSAIRTVGELARTIPDALRLEAGDPDFGTPDHIIEATARAARDGFTHYGPSAGLESLRTLLLEKVRIRNNLDCELRQVVVTAGACGALYSTLLTLLDPGDEVMIPDPAWPNYPAMIDVLGGVTTRYGLDPAFGWAPDIASIEAAITPRTKGDRGQLARQPDGGCPRARDATGDPRCCRTERSVGSCPMSATTRSSSTASTSAWQAWADRIGSSRYSRSRRPTR